MNKNHQLPAQQNQLTHPGKLAKGFDLPTFERVAITGRVCFRGVFHTAVEKRGKNCTERRTHQVFTKVVTIFFFLPRLVFLGEKAGCFGVRGEISKLLKSYFVFFFYWSAIFAILQFGV